MLTEKRILLSNATGTSYKNWNGGIDINLIEKIGNDEVKVSCEMTPKVAHDLYKSLHNALIEAKVKRGKKQY